MSRKKPILPEFLDRINQLDDIRIQVMNQGNRQDLLVHVRTHGFQLMLDKSNSGRSFQFYGHGVNTGLQGWDAAKVQSIIMNLLVPGTTKSQTAQLLRELRSDPSVKLPKMVTKIVAKIYEIYIKEMGGDDRQRRIAEARKLFDQLKDLVTEEEVVQWFREAQVKEVMES